MKKVNLITLVLGAMGMIFGFSSCKKCVTCETTYNGLVSEQKVCKESGTSKADFDAKVRDIESSYTTCK